jgi:hypothetical protein
VGFVQSLRVSGKIRGWKENLPEEMQNPEEGEEEEEAMEMARLHGSGWNGRFQKALDGGGKSAKRGTGGRGGCWRAGLR